MQHQREHLRALSAWKGVAAGQHLVGDDGKRELIGRGVRVRHAPLDLLGRHVERRAHHRPLGRLTTPARALHLRDPEVQDLDRLGLSALDRHQKDVVGLEVAVNDAVSVGRRQPRRDLVDDSDDGVERQGASPNEPLRQALAREVFHDQVLGPVGRRVVVDDLDDVGMLQAAR